MDFDFIKPDGPLDKYATLLANQQHEENTMRNLCETEDNKYRQMKVKDLKKFLKKFDDDTEILVVDGACSGQAHPLSNSSIDYDNNKIIIN